MGEHTNISWADATHNFWRGCTKVSPGCTNCYAETLVTTRLQGKWGKGAPRIRLKDFDAPLRWNKKAWVCDACGWLDALTWEGPRDAEPLSFCTRCNDNRNFHRRRVFSLSLGDWLDDEVSIEWLAEMLHVIYRTPNLDWLLLTKRPENWKTRLELALDANAWGEDEQAVEWVLDWSSGVQAPSNVCIGVSVEDQQRADERRDVFLNTPAVVRFLSVEPMLGPVDFGSMEGIHWVIFGGESHQIKSKARPCDIEWIRDGLRQCEAAGIAAFVKQLGSNATAPFFQAVKIFKDEKGADPSEWPHDLRVREFPQFRHGRVPLETANGPLTTGCPEQQCRGEHKERAHAD